MMHGLTQREQRMLPYFYQEGTLPFDGEKVTYRHEGEGIAISCKNGEAQVRLGSESYFGRSLTLLEEGFASGGDFAHRPLPAAQGWVGHTGGRPAFLPRLCQVSQRLRRGNLACGAAFCGYYITGKNLFQENLRIFTIFIVG